MFRVVKKQKKNTNVVVFAPRADFFRSSSHTPELCGMAELNLHRWWRECVSIPIGISCTGCCNIESQRGKQAAPDRRAAVALTRRVGTTTRAPKVGPGLDAMQPAPQVAEREKREQ